MTQNQTQYIFELKSALKLYVILKSSITDSRKGRFAGVEYSGS